MYLVLLKAIKKTVNGSGYSVDLFSFKEYHDYAIVCVYELAI